MLSKRQLRLQLKCLGVAVLSIATINGCSKKETGSYDMKTQSISANGCLNLGNLYASLHGMPSEGTIRAFTYDFVPSEKDVDGYSPRASRVRVANRGAYFYNEGRASNLENTWASASQDGCSSGTLYDKYGNASPYTVEEYQDAWIKVKLVDHTPHSPDPAKPKYDTVYKFALTSERSMRIDVDGFTGSQCVGDSLLASRTEISLRWGPASQLPPDESVSARYMRELSQSVAQAPAALRASVSEISTESLNLSAILLADMNNMTVNPRDQRVSECPSGAKPPTMPELPTPTPGPEPTATPIPEPEATPEATPAPEVEPSPTPEI